MRNELNRQLGANRSISPGALPVCPDKPPLSLRLFPTVSPKLCAPMHQTAPHWLVAGHYYFFQRFSRKRQKAARSGMSRQPCRVPVENSRKSFIFDTWIRAHSIEREQIRLKA